MDFSFFGLQFGNHFCNESSGADDFLHQRLDIVNIQKFRRDFGDFESFVLNHVWHDVSLNEGMTFDPTGIFVVADLSGDSFFGVERHGFDGEKRFPDRIDSLGIVLESWQTRSAIFDVFETTEHGVDGLVDWML